MASLQAAYDEFGANEAGVIYCMPNHTEDIASAGAIAMATAGVKGVGLGWGSSRPTFTFTTINSATLTISGANTWLENLVFVNNIDTLVTGIVITAADCTLKSIECRDNDANYQVDDFITTSDAADRLKIHDFVYRGNGKTGGATAMTIIGGEDIEIQPRHIDGDFSTACIEQVTTAGSIHIYGNADFPAYLRTRNSADVLVTAKSDTKGSCGPFLYGRVEDDAANITEAFVGADFSFFQPIYISNADGEHGLLTNITASTDT